MVYSPRWAHRGARRTSAAAAEERRGDACDPAHDRRRAPDDGRDDPPDDTPEPAPRTIRTPQLRRPDAPPEAVQPGPHHAQDHREAAGSDVQAQRDQARVDVLDDLDHLRPGRVERL